ncbi:MAG: hypothetical protein ACOYKR_08365 [Sphingobacterium thalpophilum]|jgi:hypothetical protein
MSKQLSVLEIADELFTYMRDNDVEIPIAMAAFAAALSMMAAQLKLPKEEVIRSFALTADTIYKQQGDEDELMH